MKKTSETSRTTTRSTGRSTGSSSNRSSLGKPKVRWTEQELKLLSRLSIRNLVFKYQTKANKFFVEGIKTPENKAAYEFFKENWPNRTPEAVWNKAWLIHKGYNGK